MRNVLIGIALLLLTCPSFAQQKTVAQRKTVAPQKTVSHKSAASPNNGGRFKWLGNCDDSGGGLCADVYTHKSYEGKYTGHEEPAMAFYSETPNSGNSMVVRLKIPAEPPTPPNQAGTGGSFNFQLHPAFWFSMILCDSQSAPEYTTNCVPDSDANIFDNPDPTKPDYINLHPGAAFMELQFYPPGWVFIPTEPTQHWVAAINIDSLNADQANVNPTFQNADCLNKVGGEPINFAFITRTGVPQAPPDPLNVVFDPFGTQLADPTQALLMNPGDDVIIFMHDHPEGFRVIIFDETTKTFGWMTTSAANGFAQIQYQPDPDPNNPSVTCSELPYSFHPMYSTSSEHTRTTWTAHAFNVGFSDELGHFEYCNAVDANFNCIAAGSSEPDGMLDFDDDGCASTLPSSPPFVAVAGCVDLPIPDLDFDSVSYGNNWPGTASDPTTDSLLHATPIQFSSPRFNAPKGLADYDRVAFESIAGGSEFSCDEITGDGCVNPPPGANFYPFYTTGALNNTCVWQFGGANILGTTNTFGGTAAAEFGPLTAINYPVGVGFPGFPQFSVFRQVLSANPCPGGVF